MSTFALFLMKGGVVGTEVLMAASTSRDSLNFGESQMCRGKISPRSLGSKYKPEQETSRSKWQGEFRIFPASVGSFMFEVKFKVIKRDAVVLNACVCSCIAVAVMI